MPTKGFSKQISIASPCNAPWDSMIGNDRVRFCEHCQLSVHNLDLTSRKQLRRLIAKSNGRLCVSYLQPLSVAPVLHKIGRRTSKIAASTFSAVLGLSAAVVANTNSKATAFPHETVSAACLVDQFSDSGTGTLRGYIFDPNGAVIAGASVSLTNLETNEHRYSITGGNGEYSFEGLKPGSYHLKIKSEGFDTREIPNITVRSDDNNRMDQTLSIAPITAEVTVQAQANIVMGGAMVITASHPLVKAAMDDDLEKLKEVLLATPDPNVRDNDTQDTALEHAVRNGNRDMVQVLLWAKADVNARDKHGQTVLMMLSEDVTSEIIWDLINAGAKVNLRDEDGDTALIAVAEVNNVDALKTFLDAGAKVNVSNNDGQTALMMAASSGLVNNLRALILAGADVNARDKEGKTALMYALKEDERAAARLLKAHGAIEFPELEKP